MTMLRHYCHLFFAFMVLAPAVQAQTPAAVLTQVKEVLELTASPPQAVHLRGVIVDVGVKRDELSLHDGHACVSVTVAEGSGVKLGDEVEVEGSTFSEPHLEQQRTRVKSSKLTVLGTKALPEPKLISGSDAAAFRHLDQWVSVEGTVLQVRSSMTLFTVQIADGAAPCNVLVRDWPREKLPRDWIGGRVRLTGVNRAYLPGNGFLSVVSPSPDQVQLIRSGVTDVFNAPESTVSKLRKTNENEHTRVKLSGTLLGVTNGYVLYVRTDDGDAFSFYLLHPIDEDKSGRYSTTIIQPQVKAGDVVEVVGLLGRNAPGVHLNFGVVRVVRPGPEPKAMNADFGAISAGRHMHDLVDTQGRLLSLDDVLVAPGRYRTTMQLTDGDQRLITYLDSPTRGALAHLQIGHQLSLRGIVTGPPHFPEIRLWLRTPADVSSLGLAKDVVQSRLWTSLGIAAALSLLLAAWVLILRRSRATVRELNAHLEERVRDRTAALEQAQTDLRDALAKERELGELKSRFVTTVSHEFRTPLGIIMSAVELLQHYSDRLPEEEKKHQLHEIQSSTKHMGGLMEQVLLLGRAEAGKLTCKPQPLDLISFADRIVDETQSISNRKCPITLQTEGDLAGARVDEALLRHILGNLVSNAVKYSPAGAEVLIQLRREGPNAVLIITDRGIGIPEKDRERLFEAFHRCSNVGEIQGTGLGLVIVKRCVDLHSGSLDLQSEVGKGTTFTVRLPVFVA